VFHLDKINLERYVRQILQADQQPTFYDVLRLLGCNWLNKNGGNIHKECT
jgi:hypothetical protein